MINVTTDQHHPNIEPYMFSISITANNFATSSPYLPNEVQITALYYTQAKINDTVISKEELIALEQCSPAHFSRVENIENDFKSWSLDQFRCLPLNKTFEIGGHPTFG